MFTSRCALPFVIMVSLLFFGACDSNVTSENESPRAVNQSANSQIVTNSMHQGPSKAQVNKALAEVRKATAPYNNLSKAKSDGYTKFSPHVPHIGIHYLHDSNINADGTSSIDDNLSIWNPEILVYVDDAKQSSQKRLVAVEYAIPKNSDHPPAQAMNLFPGLEAHDWHVHPSSHEFPISNDWTMHGECHYVGGPGVLLAENPSGDYVLFTPIPPFTGFGSWSGTVAPDQCPTSLNGNPLPPLLVVHGKWWTLHSWVWYPNPEGVFHPTNPRVSATP